MKKIILFTLICVFSALVFTACGSDQQNVSTSSTASTTVDSGAEILNDYDTKYLKWNAAEWSMATDEEKTECARAYLGYIGDLMSMKVTEADLEALPDTVEQLNLVFEASKDLSLMEIVQLGLTTD